MTLEAFTRYVGFCPICEGDFKLVPRPGVINYSEHEAMSLVHHGFIRPGDGMIHGDCFGVGWQPYELTTLVCEMWRDKMQSWLEATQRTLARLESPELDTLYGTTTEPFHKALRERDIERHGSYWWKVESEYSEDIKLWVRRDGSPWEQELFRKWRKSYIVDAKRDIGTATSEIERMTRHITSWTLKPVRTEEEWIEQDKAKRAAERAAKDAEKQAARDAKAEKRRLIDERKARWENEKLALMQMYRDLFTNLAKQPKHNGTRDAAAEIWRSMVKASRRKGYLHFYPKALEIDDTLIQLGLAAREDRWVNYAYDSGYL